MTNIRKSIKTWCIRSSTFYVKTMQGIKLKSNIDGIKQRSSVHTNKIKRHLAQEAHCDETCTAAHSHVKKVKTQVNWSINKIR